MTLIEVIVALVIVAIAISLVAIAFGGIVGAKTRQAAGDLATAVRYTYNLAAINNRVYALYIDVGEGTYHAAPLQPGNECDRVLLNVDGDEADPMVLKYRDTGERDRVGGDDVEPSQFGGVESGSDDPDPKPPDWTKDDDGTPAGMLLNMVSMEAKQLGRDEAEKAGAPVDLGNPQEGPKRIKTFRKNQLGKPRALPEGVRFGGVVLREGQEAITEGTIPILFFPHGHTQRAFIYLDSGGEEDGETFTVEVMSLQGSGIVHDFEVDPNDFAEVEP